MQRRDLHRDVIGSVLFEIVFHQSGNLLVVLVGHQAAGEFGVGLRRQHGLGAFACVAAPHSAKVEAGTHAHALDLGVAFLAAQSLHTEAVLVVFLIVRCHIEQFALAGGTFNDVVVEMRNGDVVVFVGAFGNHLAQGVERVGHAAAEEAGVEVGVGAGDLDFPIGQAAQASGDARHVGGNH